MTGTEITFSVSAGPIGKSLFFRCIRTVLRGEGRRTGFVSIVLVDDRTIRRINRRFLSHDYATDVISFPLEEEEKTAIEGEIYISVPTARRQAGIYRVSVREELARLAIHGVLHLCGYDDLEQNARKIMQTKENQYLKKSGFSLRHGL